MLEIALILLLITSVAAIQTRYLRHAVIYLGLFSLAISFVYLLYHAPDVAISEAVIGSTIATILYLVALQKYKIFTIYYRLQDEEIGDSTYLSHSKQDLIKILEKFCTKQELEAQIIYSKEAMETIITTHQYALIIEEIDEVVRITVHPENYKLDALTTFLEKETRFKHAYVLSPVEEELL